MMRSTGSRTRGVSGWRVVGLRVVTWFPSPLDLVAPCDVGVPTLAHRIDDAQGRQEMLVPLDLLRHLVDALIIGPDDDRGPRKARVF